MTAITEFPTLSNIFNKDGVYQIIANHVCYVVVALYNFLAQSAVALRMTSNGKK